MIRQMIQNIQKGILHMEMINPQEWKKDLPAFKRKDRPVLCRRIK